MPKGCVTACRFQRFERYSPVVITGNGYPGIAKEHLSDSGIDQFRDQLWS